MMAPLRYMIENMGIPLVVATQAACHPNSEDATQAGWSSNGGR